MYSHTILSAEDAFLKSAAIRDSTGSDIIFPIRICAIAGGCMPGLKKYTQLKYIGKHIRIESNSIMISVNNWKRCWLFHSWFCLFSKTCSILVTSPSCSQNRYHSEGLWWVDLGCLPDAHPATRSLPLLSRTGEKIRC